MGTIIKLYPIYQQNMALNEFRPSPKRTISILCSRNRVKTHYIIHLSIITYYDQRDDRIFKAGFLH